MGQKQKQKQKRKQDTHLFVSEIQALWSRELCQEVIGKLVKGGIREQAESLDEPAELLLVKVPARGIRAAFLKGADLHAYIALCRYWAHSNVDR